MYERILIPVDLAHRARLEKALKIGADLSKHYNAPVVYVGVTSSQPNQVAHNPKEYAEKLTAFGKEEAAKHGIEASTHPYSSHDPAVDLVETLLRAAEESGADLIVMASHVPGLSDHIFASHAGQLASHASVSVFVVR